MATDCKIHCEAQSTAWKIRSATAGTTRSFQWNPLDITNRELEVLHLMGQGVGTSQIAKKLHLSVKTVETHRAQIKGKLKLADSTELLKYAIQWAQSKNVDYSSLDGD